MIPRRDRTAEPDFGAWYDNRPSLNECILARSSGAGFATGLQVGAVH